MTPHVYEFMRQMGSVKGCDDLILLLKTGTNFEAGKINDKKTCFPYRFFLSFACVFARHKMLGVFRLTSTAYQLFHFNPRLINSNSTYGFLVYHRVKSTIVTLKLG